MIDEVKKLSNLELGKELAVLAGLNVIYFNFNGMSYDLKENPAACELLCTSLDAVSEVEKIVIEKVWFDKYGKALRSILKTKRTNLHANLAFGATASARQRAEACLLALQTLSTV